jgi:AcrR family transcriptional regulator
MPYPRFERLAQDKRELLLDTAAQEFANHGFEQASINRILEQAHMSKGAAYYYFEDKVDLFCAVIEYASERLDLASVQVDVRALTTENFWAAVAEIHRLPLMRSMDKPWLFKILNVAAQVAFTDTWQGPLASLTQQMRMLMVNLIKHGQKIGAIRTDLPDDLILAWFLALDRASDNWLMSHWQEIDMAKIVQISDQTIGALKNALIP